MITAYLQEIQEALAAYPWVQSVSVLRSDLEETDREQILVYRFRVTLQDGGLLEFMERIVYSKISATMQVTTYKYHWQDKDRNLIKRWDNAPHFPELQGFPHHVHVAQEDQVLPGRPMTTLAMLAEIDHALSEL